MYKGIYAEKKQCQRRIHTAVRLGRSGRITVNTTRNEHRLLFSSILVSKLSRPLDYYLTFQFFYVILSSLLFHFFILLYVSPFALLLVLLLHYYLYCLHITFGIAITSLPVLLSHYVLYCFYITSCTACHITVCTALQYVRYCHIALRIAFPS